MFYSTPHDGFMGVDFCFLSGGEVSLLTSADPGNSSVPEEGLLMTPTLPSCSVAPQCSQGKGRREDLEIDDALVVTTSLSGGGGIDTNTWQKA